VLETDQRAGGDTLSPQPTNDRDVDLLAAVLQFHAPADDAVEVLAHVGRKHALPDPFTIDLLGEFDQLIVGLNGGNGHGRWSFLLGRSPKKNPATRRVISREARPVYRVAKLYRLLSLISPCSLPRPDGAGREESEGGNCTLS